MRTFVENFTNIAADVLLLSTVKLIFRCANRNSTYLFLFTVVFHNKFPPIE